MRSYYLLDEDDDDCDLDIPQPPVRAFPEQPSWHVCARLGLAAKVLAVRPRCVADWRRPLEEAVTKGECPRCCLMGMPRGAINLVPEDLQDWMREAKAISPDTNFGFLSDAAKPQYPCGSCPLCQHNPKMIIQESQDMMSDLVARGAVTMGWIQGTFKGLNPNEQQMLYAYALEAESDNPNTPIKIKTLAKRFNVDVKTINRWLKKAKDDDGKAFEQLENLRNSRAERNERYEVRHT